MHDKSNLIFSCKYVTARKIYIPMIYGALWYVAQELDRFLMRKFQTPDSKVTIGPLLDESGKVPEDNQNKVLVTLVNLEQESAMKYNTPPKIGEINAKLNVPFNFNLGVLFTSVFNNYDEALKFLSAVIYFFQNKNVFDHHNSPGLDPSISRLIFEITKLDYQEMQSLWAIMGTTYRPSILFKIRMLSQSSDEIKLMANVDISGVKPNI